MVMVMMMVFLIVGGKSEGKELLSKEGFIEEQSITLSVCRIVPMMEIKCPSQERSRYAQLSVWPIVEVGHAHVTA